MYIYIAGPLTHGDPLVNTRNAILAGEAVRKAGHIPFIPHLDIVWNLVVPGITYEDWMDWDLAWLSRCDALICLPGYSPGAAREVAAAKEAGLPVYHLEQFLALHGGQR